MNVYVEPSAPIPFSDRYKGAQIRLGDGPFKGRLGTVCSTHPDTSILEITVEGVPNVAPRTHLELKWATHVGTELPLKDAMAMNRADREAREGLVSKERARAAAKALPPPVLGPPSQEWPEVFEQERVFHMPVVGEANRFTLPPGKWLRQPQLTGHRLDVVLESHGKYHNGRYDGQIGCIETLPPPTEIQSGQRGVVPVSFGPESSRSSLRFRVHYIFPLQTTECPADTRFHVAGVSADEARPIDRVDGVQVVVIGPDMSMCRDHIGKRGWIGRDGVHCGASVLQVSISSLCRADDHEPRLRAGPLI
ncbi:hypothetical protein C8R44DRAFT_806156 [Mycena epipterygia]|nr:hypothetical protein C8R44DRAFT_826661 [Mycena epipterygia]KAJ7105820.1 hypothetical protein C8R44DRAFT_806156 [Mycena epipterygia]